ERQPQRIAGHAADPVVPPAQQVLDLEVESDAEAVAEGFEQVRGAGADVEHRAPAAQAPQQTSIHADAATVTVEPPQVAQRARDVIGRRVVFVEELGLVEALHELPGCAVSRLPGNLATR